MKTEQLGCFIQIKLWLFTKKHYYIFSEIFILINKLNYFKKLLKFEHLI